MVSQYLLTEEEGYVGWCGDDGAMGKIIYLYWVDAMALNRYMADNYGQNMIGLTFCSKICSSSSEIKLGM